MYQRWNQPPSKASLECRKYIDSKKVPDGRGFQSHLELRIFFLVDVTATSSTHFRKWKLPWKIDPRPLIIPLKGFTHKMPSKMSKTHSPNSMLIQFKEGPLQKWWGVGVGDFFYLSWIFFVGALPLTNVSIQ